MTIQTLQLIVREVEVTSGDDVVYLYTAENDTSINVKFTPAGTWSGIYVYENAEDIKSELLDSKLYKFSSGAVGF